MDYRRARRRDIATQGEAAADDLDMVMDDRWQGTFWDVRRTTATTELQPHAAFRLRLQDEIRDDYWNSEVSEGKAMTATCFQTMSWSTVWLVGPKLQLVSVTCFQKKIQPTLRGRESSSCK